MKTLIVLGTTRDGRNTVKPAKAVLEEFEEQGHETTFFDLKEKEIPMLGNRTYVDDEDPVPEDIEEFADEVEEADLIVLVAPEYNHSVPGALKNTLDYLFPEYNGKAFSYVTVSAGGFGGIRALDHLQDITLGLGGHPGPNLPISNVSTNFEDEQPTEEYQEKIKNFVGKTENFVEKIN
ncbi:NADPH-dependent FMN reductase [Candidatus Nanohalococcus occultus]|uniref:NADPH-dependent FMN reductase n=1 Tax=Candidatus Nanohalococcus occultus TaxID=2978047 RepID=UPI0039E14839